MIFVELAIVLWTLLVLAVLAHWEIVLRAVGVLFVATLCVLCVLVAFHMLADQMKRR